MGKNSPSQLRSKAKQLQKEKDMCFSDYARSILNAARSQQVFQYNPFSTAKSHRMACILKSEGYLQLEKKIKPGWWNLVLSKKGIALLEHRIHATNTPADAVGVFNMGEHY